MLQRYCKYFINIFTLNRFCSNVYKNALGVFNCALTGENNVNIANLYLANFSWEGEISQGSSIFSHKDNVSKEKHLPTIGVPSKLFFDVFKDVFMICLNMF